MPTRIHIPSVTFLALTDAVTGMIGVLLIVLVLAQPPEEQIHRLQQADIRIVCESAAASSDDNVTRTIIRLLESGKRIPLDHFLRQRHIEQQMSVRLAVTRDVNNPQESACLAQLRAEVEHINDAYEENRSVIHYPYVFLSAYRHVVTGETSP